MDEEERGIEVSAFRRLPGPEDVESNDAWGMKLWGVRGWLARRDAETSTNWNSVADEAAALKLAGYEAQDIANILSVNVDDLMANVDLSAIEALIKGEITKEVFKHAFSGDSSMLKFVATHKLGWEATKHVTHSGSVGGIAPVLNINLSTLAPPASIDITPTPPQLGNIGGKNGKKGA